MTAIINPFDASGYTLTEMTTAINILPNIYTRLGELGLFRFEGVTQRSVMIEQAEGVLDLLPTVPLGAPATVANRTSRSTRSFSVPWIPHDDIITPQDIQGIRGFGVADAADPLTTVMERKLTRMRAKHAQTREYMEINALRGVVKDGAGFALYDYFAEFGLAQISVDFLLGTAGTNVQAKCREVLRNVETELKGETMNGILALVSPTFFDKLIGHAKVEEAYKYYSTTGAQPLREDTRRRFPFAGLVFEEYNATVTLATGATETLVPGGRRHRVPAWHAGHVRNLRLAGQSDRDRQHDGPADVCAPDRAAGRQRNRREDRGIAAAGQQAPSPRGQDPDQQLSRDRLRRPGAWPGLRHIREAGCAHDRAEHLRPCRGRLHQGRQRRRREHDRRADDPAGGRCPPDRTRVRRHRSWTTWSTDNSRWPARPGASKVSSRTRPTFV